MAQTEPTWGITTCEHCGNIDYVDEDDICIICCGVGEVGWELLPIGILMIYVIN